MVSSQLLGSKGPWSDWIGYGPSTQPISGLCALWDYADEDPPAGSTLILPNDLAGRVLAVGAMAGLIAVKSGQMWVAMSRWPKPSRGDGHDR